MSLTPEANGFDQSFQVIAGCAQGPTGDDGGTDLFVQKMHLHPVSKTLGIYWPFKNRPTDFNAPKWKIIIKRHVMSPKSSCQVGCRQLLCSWGALPACEDRPRNLGRSEAQVIVKLRQKKLCFSSLSTSKWNTTGSFQVPSRLSGWFQTARPEEVYTADFRRFSPLLTVRFFRSMIPEAVVLLTGYRAPKVSIRSISDPLEGTEMMEECDRSLRSSQKWMGKANVLSRQVAIAVCGSCGNFFHQDRVLTNCETKLSSDVTAGDLGVGIPAEQMLPLLRLQGHGGQPISFGMFGVRFSKCFFQTLAVTCYLYMYIFVQDCTPVFCMHASSAVKKLHRALLDFFTKSMESWRTSMENLRRSPNLHCPLDPVTSFLF